MDDILEQAKKLAEMLANDPRTAAFRDAAKAVEADEAASRLQAEYAMAVDAVRSREMAGRPIEPEHKRALIATSEQVRKSPKLIAMLQAHAAYVDLMDAVQAILAGSQPGSEQEVEGHDHDHDHEGHDHAGHAHDEKREEEPPRSSVLWTP
jgi:cell fate (sporulation/competence/biofilm development) regulator YlbF (YheA/YmcA/DUF963 family)